MAVIHRHSFIAPPSIAAKPAPSPLQARSNIARTHALHHHNTPATTQLNPTRHQTANHAPHFHKSYYLCKVNSCNTDTAKGTKTMG